MAITNQPEKYGLHEGKNEPIKIRKEASSWATMK